jgi:hypothetical protein
MMRIFVVVCALALAGCGAAKVDPRVDARAEYQKSLDEYQACINMSFKNVQKCEGKRVLMESNWRTYNNVAAGIKQNTTNTAATSQGVNTAGATQSTNTTSAAQVTSSPPPVATSAAPQTSFRRPVSDLSPIGD